MVSSFASELSPCVVVSSESDTRRSNLLLVNDVLHGHWSDEGDFLHLHGYCHDTTRDVCRINVLGSRSSWNYSGRPDSCRGITAWRFFLGLLAGSFERWRSANHWICCDFDVRVEDMLNANNVLHGHRAH
jgi:hypothetical protein